MDSIKNTGLDCNMNRMMKAFALLVVVMKCQTLARLGYSTSSDRKENYAKRPVSVRFLDSGSQPRCLKDCPQERDHDGLSHEGNVSGIVQDNETGGGTVNRKLNDSQDAQNNQSKRLHRGDSGGAKGNESTTDVAKTKTEIKGHNSTASVTTGSSPENNKRQMSSVKKVRKLGLSFKESIEINQKAIKENESHLEYIAKKKLEIQRKIQSNMELLKDQSRSDRNNLLEENKLLKNELSDREKKETELQKEIEEIRKLIKKPSKADMESSQEPYGQPVLEQLSGDESSEELQAPLHTGQSTKQAPPLVRQHAFNEEISSQESSEDSNGGEIRESNANSTEADKLRNII